MPAREAGDTVPDLNQQYADAEGIEHNIAEDLAKGPVLLGIYKSSCAASKAMMPMLDRIFQRYQGEGLATYGIAQDSANITRSFARRTGVNYPILIEGDGYPITAAFDIFATPTVYVLGADGTIAYTTMGFMRDQVNDIAAAVANLLQVEPEPIVSSDEEGVPLFVPG